jgi:hypothetical protein
MTITTLAGKYIDPIITSPRSSKTTIQSSWAASLIIESPYNKFSKKMRAPAQTAER